MKKTLVAAILGLAVAPTVFGQGAVQLYNYAAATILANEIKYGVGSGGTLGNSVTGGLTVGVYYFIGNNVAAVDLFTGGGTTQAGANNGTLVGSGVTLGTGAGSTVAIADSFVNSQAGQFGTPAYFTFGTAGDFPGTADKPCTFVVVAYNGANYESSTVRGHSAAFLFTAANIAGTSFVQPFNAAMPGFAVTAVTPVPEPSTFALAGLGLAGLLIFRRRN